MYVDFTVRPMPPLLIAFLGSGVILWRQFVSAGNHFICIDLLPFVKLYEKQRAQIEQNSIDVITLLLIKTKY